MIVHTMYYYITPFPGGPILTPYSFSRSSLVKTTVTMISFTLFKSPACIASKNVLDDNMNEYYRRCVNDYILAALNLYQDVISTDHEDSRQIQEKQKELMMID